MNKSINESAEKPVVPTPVVQIKITLMSDGAMNVNGFPTELEIALAIMQDAIAAIVKHFVEEAKEGKLDHDNSFMEDKILTPGNGVPI